MPLFIIFNSSNLPVLKTRSWDEVARQIERLQDTPDGYSLEANDKEIPPAMVERWVSRSATLGGFRPLTRKELFEAGLQPDPPTCQRCGLARSLHPEDGGPWERLSTQGTRGKIPMCPGYREKPAETGEVGFKPPSYNERGELV